MGDMKNIHKEITIPNRIFLKGKQIMSVYSVLVMFLFLSSFIS